MKELLLLRHAKSSWENPHLNDFERPLNARGQQDAPMMTNWIKQHFQVDYLLVSPAKRTTLTADFIVDAYSIPKHKIIYEKELYLGSQTQLLRICRQLPSTLSHVMLVGHNPGITDLGQYFLPTVAPDNIPTAGILSLQFNTDEWESIDPSNCIHHNVKTPKTLKKQQ